MADNQNTATGTGGGASDADAAAELGARLAALPRIVLAHSETKRRAVPGTDKTEPLPHEPAAVLDVVNIYGHPPIYFPSADEQRAGFTPLFVATRNGRPTAVRFRTAKGEEVNRVGGFKAAGDGATLELDIDSAAEAVRAVLTQFVGVYKPSEEKGA